MNASCSAVPIIVAPSCCAQGFRNHRCRTRAVPLLPSDPVLSDHLLSDLSVSERGHRTSEMIRVTATAVRHLQCPSSRRSEGSVMFIAMNKFQVVPERENDFETIWKERDSYLQEVPGFVQFALLRGDVEGEYISHSTWADRDAFLAWTQSESFRRAHSGMRADFIMGPGEFSAYDVRVFSQPQA